MLKIVGPLSIQIWGITRYIQYDVQSQSLGYLVFRVVVYEMIVKEIGQ